MNKKEFNALKNWFNKAKPVLRTEPISLRASELFMVRTSYDEVYFSNAKDPILSTIEKRFPEFYAQVGEHGYLNHDELDGLFFSMRRNKDLRALVI